MVSCARRLAALPVVAMTIGTPWTCNMVVAPPDSPGQGTPVTPAPPPPPPRTPDKRPEVPMQRVSVGTPPAAPPKQPLVAEEVIVRALDVGQPMFVRCFRKAHDADPTWSSMKVKVHLEIDANGLVSAVSSDASDPALAACLARIARNLPFPNSGKPAALDLPLFFRT